MSDRIRANEFDDYPIPEYRTDLTPEEREKGLREALKRRDEVAKRILAEAERREALSRENAQIA